MAFLVIHKVWSSWPRYNRDGAPGQGITQPVREKKGRPVTLCRQAVSAAASVSSSSRKLGRYKTANSSASDVAEASPSIVPLVHPPAIPSPVNTRASISAAWGPKLLSLEEPRAKESPAKPGVLTSPIASKNEIIQEVCSGGAQPSKSPRDQASAKHHSDKALQKYGAECRQLRFDANLSLWSLLDTSDLDTGYDWRFVDPQEWVDVKAQLISRELGLPDRFTVPEKSHSGRAETRMWHNLTTCVIRGTRQAIARDCYPLIVPKGRLSVIAPDVMGKKGRHQVVQRKWVDISQHRRKLLRMIFFQTSLMRHKNSPLIGLSNSNQEHPPVVVCGLSPADATIKVERIRRQICLPNEAPAIVLGLDVDLDGADGVERGVGPLQGDRPLGEGTSLEAFMLRSDLEPFLTQASKRLSVSASSSLGEHFSARHDPYGLYCEDVVLFRQNSTKGYTFLERPVIFDLILYSMTSSRPTLRRAKHEQSDQNGEYSSEYTSEYASEVDVKALDLRLQLLAESALKMHQEHEEPQKEAPILILALPGCLDGQRHPVAGVARIVSQFREKFADQFSAIVLACGSDDENLIKQVDGIVNEDFNQVSGDLHNLMKDASWPQCLKSILHALSVNSGWGDTVGKKRQETFMTHLQAQEHLRQLQKALVRGVSKSNRSYNKSTSSGTNGGYVDGDRYVELEYEPGANTIADMLREERLRQQRERAETALTDDVQRLVQGFSKQASVTRARRGSKPGIGAARAPAPLGGLAVPFDSKPARGTSPLSPVSR